ncbi:MAG: hypothetical protein ACE5G7_01565 [Candidatus Hydrothermarchaeaceae archaeon]
MIEYILLIGALVASSAVTFGIYSTITSSSEDVLENSTNVVSDQMSVAILEAIQEMDAPDPGGVELIEVEEEEYKTLNAVYGKDDLTEDKCVKVDVGGSAVVNFTVPYEQTVKIHRPSMHLKLSNFCDISVETVTLAVDGRVYWHFEKSFFNWIKEWLRRIRWFGKLKNYNHHFYYRNIELTLGPGEHEIVFRWTGTAYAKSNSAYSGEIRAAVTRKVKRSVEKHSIGGD